MSTDETKRKNRNLFKEITALYLDGVQLICLEPPGKSENDDFFRMLRVVDEPESRK